MTLVQDFNSSKSHLVLSHNDWDFITDISARFPERQPSIYDRFIYMDMVAPQFRPRDALALIKIEPRQGLIQRGWKLPRSVYTHERGISRILGQIFRENSALKEKYNSNKARMILVHDIGEGLTTDFTPFDMEQGKITEAQKTRLEDLAMKLIFCDDQPRYQAYLDYKNKSDYSAYVVKAGDFLEWWDDAIRIDPHPDLVEELVDNASNVKGPVRKILIDMTPTFFKINPSQHSEYVGAKIMRALN